MTINRPSQTKGVRLDAPTFQNQSLDWVEIEKFGCVFLKNKVNNFHKFHTGGQKNCVYSAVKVLKKITEVLPTCRT